MGIKNWIRSRVRWLQLEIEIQLAIIKNEYPSGLIPEVWVSRMRKIQENVLKGFDF